MLCFFLYEPFRVLYGVFRLFSEMSFVKHTQWLLISGCTPMHTVNTYVKRHTMHLTFH